MLIMQKNYDFVTFQFVKARVHLFFWHFMLLSYYFGEKKAECALNDLDCVNYAHLHNMQIINLQNLKKP